MTISLESGSSRFLGIGLFVPGVLAILGACSDGSEGLKKKDPVTPSSGGTTSTTTGGTSTGGTSGGSATTGGGTSGGSTSTGGADPAGGTGTGGSGASGGSAAVGGPFKMLVLSRTLEWHHDSIDAGHQMLEELGATVDANLPAGALTGSQFTVDYVDPDGTDLHEFTDENLANYAIVFSDNPTGTVFTSASDGDAAKAAFQKFVDNGGSWGGVHSATDFEKTAGWDWFHDNIDAAYFVGHNDDGTQGSVVWEAAAVAEDHPVIRGLPSPWSCTDEWYNMNRKPETVPGFTILGRLGSDQREAVWVRELSGGGRSFYTIRGHNITVYAEPAFRQLVHQGILWAVHRME